jgi:hypothetical protein
VSVVAYVSSTIILHTTLVLSLLLLLQSNCENTSTQLRLFPHSVH